MINLPVKVSGIVLHGRALGRTIGMPTVNIIPDTDLSELAFGVYYSRVYLEDGRQFKGITNVGIKPTVQSTTAINVETYLYNFSENLYDNNITVELLEFRRPEMKFTSIDELSAQLHKDLEAGQLYNSNTNIFP